jgi:hypothetical protein
MQHLSPFHVRAVTCDRPGTADTQIMISQKALCLVFAKLGQSAFSSVAIRNLTDQDITELILESDWCSSSEDKDISAQSDSDTATLLTQTSHGGLTIQAVDLLYL